MPKTILHLFFLLILIQTAYAQESRLDETDKFLASNFKTLHTVDTELRNCMAPIIEGRVIAELKDAESFKHPFDSLAHYVKIRTSKDSLLRTFSWDRRSGGSWHSMASYAQYKTTSGKINIKRLDVGDEFNTGAPTAVLIYDVYPIITQNDTYYLVLGWGTYGGGEQHSLARVYKIDGETLTLCNSIFNGKKHLVIHANRGSEINLEYDTASRTLSFFDLRLMRILAFMLGKAKKKNGLLMVPILVKVTNGKPN